MITGLRGVTTWSEDLNNLLPFYRDVLGLKVTLESPGFVVLADKDGATFALGTHSELHGPAKEPQRHILGVGTDDIHAEHKRLKEQGFEFLEEPVDGGTVWFATFKDPEGNYVQLLQFKDQT